MTNTEAASLDKALNNWIAAQNAEKAALNAYASGASCFEAAGIDAYQVVQNARAETRKAEGIYTRLFRRFNAAA
jgi:hypothetical protein